jgi:hypothetical protein
MLHNTAAELLYLRNLILAHVTLIDPWPHGRLSLVTYPNPNNTWDVRIVVVVSHEPYEARVLGHVNESLGEMAGLREMLHALRQSLRQKLGGTKTGDVVGSAGIVGEYVDVQGRFDRWSGASIPQRRQEIPLRWDPRVGLGNNARCPESRWNGAAPPARYGVGGWNVGAERLQDQREEHQTPGY